MTIVKVSEQCENTLKNSKVHTSDPFQHFVYCLADSLSSFVAVVVVVFWANMLNGLIHSKLIWVFSALFFVAAERSFYFFEANVNAIKYIYICGEREKLRCLARVTASAAGWASALCLRLNDSHPTKGQTHSSLSLSAFFPHNFFQFKFFLRSGSWNEIIISLGLLLASLLRARLPSFKLLNRSHLWVGIVRDMQKWKRKNWF